MLDVMQLLHTTNLECYYKVMKEYVTQLSSRFTGGNAADFVPKNMLKNFGSIFLDVQKAVEFFIDTSQKSSDDYIEAGQAIGEAISMVLFG